MNFFQNIQSEPTPVIFKLSGSMIPFDTSKLIFQATPGMDSGDTFVDSLPVPFQLKNTHSTLSVYISWALFQITDGNQTARRNSSGSCHSSSIDMLVTNGTVFRNSASSFLNFPLLSYLNQDGDYLGTAKLTEIAGYAFVYNSGFGTPASSYAAAPNNTVAAQSFKYSPNLDIPYNFSYASTAP